MRQGCLEQLSRLCTAQGHMAMGLPGWSSGEDSKLPRRAAWVRSLVRKPDPTCCN